MQRFLVRECNGFPTNLRRTWPQKLLVISSGVSLPSLSASSFAKTLSAHSLVIAVDTALLNNCMQYVCIYVCVCVCVCVCEYACVCVCEGKDSKTREGRQRVREVRGKESY